MHKQPQRHHTLAACLRNKQAQPSIFNDTAFNIFNRKLFCFNLRKKYALAAFGTGVATTIFSPNITNALSMPTMLARLDMAGFLFAALPFLAVLYLIDRTLRSYKATKSELSPIYNFMFITAPCLIALFDSGIIGAPFHMINLAGFALATALLWPTKRRRNYYSKKHIDKRT